MIAIVAGSATQAAGIAAGCEEEGVPVDVVVEEGPGDAVERARRAAVASPLGIGVGGDAAHVVVVLAAASARPYVMATSARRAGHAAGRIAARRPL